MDKTVWEIVQETMIDNGIDVYPPATKKGDCKDFYAVLKDDGASQVGSFSSEYHYYTLLCYAPKDKYVELLRFVESCKEVMEKEPIFPMLMPTGTQTPSFYDDTFNAYMISIQYRNNVRNIHL